jgi:high-affinity K+ transport system ATPase subunit B
MKKLPSFSSIISLPRLTQVLTAVLLLITFPMPAAAQYSSGGKAYDFSSLVALFIGMIKTLVPLVVGLTLLYFIWGIFRLVQSNSEDSRKEAIGVITYGVVSLFVMVSVWGLVSILTSTFFGGGLIVPQLR